VGKRLKGRYKIEIIDKYGQKGVSNNHRFVGRIREIIDRNDTNKDISEGSKVTVKFKLGDSRFGPEGKDPDFYFKERRLCCVFDGDKYDVHTYDGHRCEWRSKGAGDCILPSEHSWISIEKETIITHTEELEVKDMEDDCIELLEAKHNLILTGAPGTGKTHLAKKIAERMRKGSGTMENDFVQFHPSYDYTDFVEGLRPTQPDANGNIGFKLTNGIFKNFCKKAKESPKENFVFIIDEINRGEISKIFGELFFSVDPGYRGEKGKVKTQYTNMQSKETETLFDSELGKGWFYIPENVFIIGTMNDIDRSVESFDFAMRRRFVWKEITAEDSAKAMKLPENTEKRMMRLNDAISKIDGMGSSYHIGGSYFLEKNDDKEPPVEPDYKNLWKLRLEHLLREYLRGRPDAEDELENLRKTYFDE